MKRALVLAALLLLAVLALAPPVAAFVSTGDGAWVWQFPLPTGDSIRGQAFDTSTSGWRVGGDGLVLRTTDRGAHWRQQLTPVLGTFTAVAAPGAGRCVAVGWEVPDGGSTAYRPMAVRTTDGGRHWTETTLPLAGAGGFMGVGFSGRNTGWAVGSPGLIAHTDDGGGSWTLQTTTPAYAGYFWAVAATDATHAWAVGESGTIYGTTDVGATWTAQTSGTGEGLRSIAVLKDHGLLIGGGSGGDLTGSGDGTWTAGPATGLGGVYDLFPYGDGDAWAAGSGGLLGHLTGGGTAWGTVDTGSGGSLNAVDFWGGTVGLAAGGDGAAARTTNGGATWASVGSSAAGRLPGYALIGASVVDRKNVWTVGYDDVCLRTTNGGTTWTKVPLSWSDVGHYTEAIGFVSPTEGWVGGDVGAIAHTTDAGIHWQAVAVPDAGWMMGISMASAATGVALSDVYGPGPIRSGRLSRTTDGGGVWQTTDLSAYGGLNGLAMADAGHQKGWIVGDAGVILATTDGGTGWSPQTSGVLTDLWAAAVAKGTHGMRAWAVGADGTVLHTTDGGADWAAVPCPARGTLTAVAAPDAVDAWIGGDDTGGVWQTSDAGAHWRRLKTGATQFAGSLVFADRATGWFVGGQGVAVLKTATGGWPDRTGPRTHIAGASVKSGKTASLRYWITDQQSVTVKATLKIRDAKGRLVKTVKLGKVTAFAPGLGRPRSAPLAKVKWSLPKGTYLAALYARDASGDKQTRLGKAKVTVK